MNTLRACAARFARALRPSACRRWPSSYTINYSWLHESQGRLKIHVVPYHILFHSIYCACNFWFITNDTLVRPHLYIPLFQFFMVSFSPFSLFSYLFWFNLYNPYRNLVCRGAFSPFLNLLYTATVTMNEPLRDWIIWNMLLSLRLFDIELFDLIRYDLIWIISLSSLTMCFDVFQTYLCEMLIELSAQ